MHWLPLIAIVYAKTQCIASIHYKYNCFIRANVLTIELDECDQVNGVKAIK